MANSTDLRLLLSEFIQLEPEQFDQARDLIQRVTGEAHQWQKHLNILALIGFEQWLTERIQKPKIHQNLNILEDVCYINIGEFKICLIATEQLLDEVVSVPHNIINQSELAAHLYVIIEVLEEEEQVIIRGILRHDQLDNYRLQVNLQPIQEGYYQIPLSLFDAEPNHLLFYCRFLEPTAIPLPVGANASSSVPLLEYLQETRTKLSQWLEGVFDEGWQAIDALINPEVNLAFNTRNNEQGTKRAKLIDLAVQLGNLTVALLVNITEETEDKLGILIQLHPTGGETYLPPNLKITLLSKAGKILQEVTSRSQDNYIQLKPFKGELGKCFCIKVSWGDVSIQECFEL